MAKKNKKKLNVFFKILLVINILAALLLLFSFSSSFINPAKFWLPAFAGILYPYILLVNILFILFWLFFRVKHTLLSLLPVLIGYSFIGSFIQFNMGKEPGSNDKTVKVMSFNVHNFDMYNYKKNWDFNFEKRNRIFDFLRKESPDIVCFQEFVNDLDGGFKTLDTLVTFMKARNVHAEYSVVAKNVYQFGLATFTKFPIVSKGVIKFPNSFTNFCIYTDIIINDDTIRVYNAHLQSIHLDNSDIEFADKLATGNTDSDDAQLKNKALRIIRFMKRAYVKRARQVDIIAAHIKTSSYPVIFCTDLNDTPYSYTYHQLSTLLVDGFKEAGFGLGTTYNKIFPSFRIDYIFVSNTLKVYNFKNITSDLSDHYPVSCLVGSKKR